MSHLKLIIGFCLALTGLQAWSLPAFPGAEGAGANAVGGRGGTVFHVTTTNDNGSSTLAGSLRQGVSVANRTIVFDVSGTINLASDLKITATNLTIAGQTAPGDGIAIKGWSFIVENTHDVVVRYLRCRPGDVNGTNFQGDSFDFLFATNVIADHISATWSVDECLSPTHFENVTIQWCIIGESMNKSVHVKGPHGYGSLIKYTDKMVTFHHNLYAHNVSRNPRPGSSVKLDFVNNVLYDWGGFSGYNGDDTPEELSVGGLYFTNTINYVSNCFVTGPNTGTSHQTNAFDSGVTNALQCRIFQAGNYMDGNRNAVLDGTEGDASLFTGLYTPLASRYAALPQTTTDNPTTAYERVLAFVGASQSRDAADDRVIRTVRNHNGCIIDFISSNSFAGDYITNNVSGTNYIGVNPWPTLNSTATPLDTDQDGMPDYWEKNLGLNPNIANNNHTNTSGYTDLEDYLNFLGDPHNFGGVNATNFTDLRELTGGDSNLIFTVASPTNGVVSLAADGITAQFLPATNYIGLAYFTFSVTNATNHTAFGPVVVASFITNLPPVIVSQPASSTNAPGSTATFSVGAANASLVYRWQRNGTNLVSGGNISNGVTNTTLTLTNLVATDTGNYSVVITNFMGAVTSSVAVLSVVPNSAPAAPTGLTATASNALVLLNWSASPTATGYNVKRSFTGGSGYATIASIAGTNYSDLQVTNGRTYFYVVTATNVGGKSVNSAEVSATPKAVVFSDTFASSSINSATPAAPTASGTSYELISTKSWNPTPTISAGHLKFGIAATGSGVIEAQALFASSPITLANVGDTISLTVTFTNTVGLFAQTNYLGFGLYNSGQNYPVPGGLNSTATSAFTTYTNGNAQRWVGYVGQLNFTNAGSQILTRPMQTASTLSNNCQDVVTSGSSSSSYNYPAGVTVGTVSSAASVVLPTNSLYTAALTITLTAGNALAISNVLYAGADTGGTLLSQFGGVASGSTYLTNSFDALAIGWRAAIGAAPTMIDIKNISVSAGVSASVAAPPAAPANLQASPTNLLIKLNWDPVSGATAYNLKRGTTNGGAYPTVFSSLTGTNYSDANVTNAVNYFYVVTAISATGESTNSAPAHAVPLPSNQPTNIVMQAAGGLMQLSWPQDHLGWRLLIQTNDLSSGLGTNWATVPNSTNVNTANIAINPADGSVFLKLVYP